MPDILLSILFALLFGAAMKIADLLDEHGLAWFFGDAYIFGVLWGILGGVLIASDHILGNVLIAMVLAFIIQMRIDYVNHAIGTVIMVIAFLMYGIFDQQVFTVFFASFVIFGLARAYIGDIRKIQDWLFTLFEPGWIPYYIVPLFWAFRTGDWLPFFILAAYRTAYNVIKYGLYWSGLYARF